VAMKQCIILRKEASILAIDAERERISLGIKQLERDPFDLYIAENPKGSIVQGIIGEVSAKGAVVSLGEGIEGNIRASEIARDRVEDARSALNSGDEIEARLIGVDRKNHTIMLSIKAKDFYEEEQSVKDYNKSTVDGSSSSTTIGDLIKEQMDNK